MSVSVRCTSCGASYNLSPSLEGKKVRCKECQEIFLARGKPGSDEMLDAVPVEDEPAPAREERRNGLTRSAGRGAERSSARAALDRVSRPRARADEDDEDSWDDSRRRPRKKEGGNGLLLGILLGGGLLLLLGLGIGVYAIYQIGANVEETVDNVADQFGAGQKQVNLDPNNWVVPPGRLEVNPGGRSPSTIDEALAALRSPAPRVREMGARWLGNNDIPAERKVEVTQALASKLGDFPDSVAEEAKRALEKVATSESMARVVAIASDSHNRGWLRASELLVTFKRPEAAEVLAGHLTRWGERQRVIEALRTLGPQAQTAVLAYRFHSDNGVREAVEKLLDEYNTPASLRAEQAIKDLTEGNPQEKQVVLAWLGTEEGNDELRPRVALLLNPLLGDANHDVRSKASEAAVKWGTKENVPALVDLVNSDKFTPWDNHQKKMAMQALGRIKDERAAAPIARHLNNGFFWQDARKALEEMGPIAEAAVLEVLNHQDANYRKHAQELLVLYKTSDGKRFDRAIADLRDPDPRRQQQAALVLAQVEPIEEKKKTVSEAAQVMLEDPKYSVRVAGATLLEKWATSECVPALIKALGDDQGGFEGQELRRKALKILGDLKDPQAVPAIIAYFRHPFEREHTRKALIAMGPASEPAILELLSTSKDARIHSEAFQVLREVGTEKSVPFLQAVIKQAAAQRNRALALTAQGVLDSISSRKGPAPAP